jgi:hypothetical protein
MINRHFKPLLKDAGLPNIRLHDLRHIARALAQVPHSDLFTQARRRHVLRSWSHKKG